MILSCGFSLVLQSKVTIIMSMAQFRKLEVNDGIVLVRSAGLYNYCTKTKIISSTTISCVYTCTVGSTQCSGCMVHGPSAVAAV